MNALPQKNSIRKHDRQKVVFIIDDDDDVSEMMHAALSDTSALVKVASSAESGLRAADVLVVDVILIDIFMPGKGGIWAISKLKERHPNAAIISMSGGWKGMSPERAVKAAKMSGAHFGFSKPFDIWEVHALINGILDEDQEVMNRLALAPGLEPAASV